MLQRFGLLFCFVFCLFKSPLFCDSNEDIPVLDTQQLKELVTGNTFIGRFHDSNGPYAIYFDPDGKVYLQKAGGPFTYYGKWSLSKTILKTPWPYEDLPITTKNKWFFFERRDLRKYTLEFRKVGENEYEPYKVRNCSCDPSPEFAFPHCKWHAGQVPLS